MSLSPPYWSGLVAVPKISSPVTLKGLPDRNILLRDRTASSLIACFFSSGNLEEIQLRNRGQAQVLVYEEVYDLLSKHGICLTWSQLDAIQTSWRIGLLTPVLRFAPSVPDSFLKSLCLNVKYLYQQLESRLVEAQLQRAARRFSPCSDTSSLRIISFCHIR